MIDLFKMYDYNIWNQYLPSDLESILSIVAVGENGRRIVRDFIWRRQSTYLEKLKKNKG